MSQSQRNSPDDIDGMIELSDADDMHTSAYHALVKAEVKEEVPEPFADAAVDFAMSGMEGDGDGQGPCGADDRANCTDGARDDTSSSGQGSVAPPSGQLRCALCRATPEHADLASPGRSKMTPFQCLRPWTARGMCDHCEAIMRYHEGTPKSPSAMARRFVESPEAHVEFLSRLAMFCAIKQTETRANVLKVTLNKHLAMAQAFQENKAELMSRAGLPLFHQAGCLTVGLKDYAKVHGNPLVNGDAICPGLCNDEYQIMVETKRLFPEGRYSLREVVEQAAGAQMNRPILEVLADARVDSLETCGLVRSLVCEFANREAWKGQVDCLRAAKLPRSRADSQSSRSMSTQQRVGVSATDASASGIQDRGAEDAEADGSEAMPHMQRDSTAAREPEQTLRTPRDKRKGLLRTYAPQTVSPASGKTPEATPTRVDNALMAPGDKKLDGFDRRTEEFCMVFVHSGCDCWGDPGVSGTGPRQITFAHGM